MTCNDENALRRGDDTNAFGQNWLTINANIPTGWTISQADIRIGTLPIISFENPVFPLTVNLSQVQTRQLQNTNTIYMAVYDTQGRKQTCVGTISFNTNTEVV